MTWVIVSVIIGAVVTAGLFFITHIFDNESWNLIPGMLSFLSAIFLVLMIALLGICGFEYDAAKVKASVVNRECGTNYTQDEIFYASDVIDKIQEIKRSRVEINGNLLRGKE